MTNNTSKKPAAKRTAPRKRVPPKVRSEASEQMEVARVLRMNDIMFAYIQNDNPSMKNKQYREKARAMGLLVGCPDLLIFDAPEGIRGVTLEMKRSDKDERALSEKQVHVREKFAQRGWATVVGCLSKPPYWN